MKRLVGILTFTASLAVLAQAQTFLTNGLVAYYPLNGNANDASGNGNNGTLVGSDTKFLADRLGNANSSLWLNTTSTPAYNLDGAYVTAPRSEALDFNNDFTLSLWVNLSSGNGTTNLPENLISNGDDNTSMNLRLVSLWGGDGSGNDILQFIWGGPEAYAYILLPPVRETWCQITAVHSGTSVSLFKNGVFLTNFVSGTSVNKSTISLGRFTESGNNSYYPLYGGMDDVRMYNRALSDSEVQQLHAYESGPRVNIIKAVKPSFSNLALTTNYQLQVSGDLSAWTNTGSAFTATNTSMVYPQYWDVDNWGQLFFRLQVGP